MKQTSGTVELSDADIAHCRETTTGNMGLREWNDEHTYKIAKRLMEKARDAAGVSRCSELSLSNFWSETTNNPPYVGNITAARVDWALKP